MKEYGPLIETRCPACNYSLTGATLTYGPECPPEKGDATVCINCGQILLFEADLTLRKPTREEVRNLMSSKEAWAVIDKARLFIERRGKFA